MAVECSRVEAGVGGCTYPILYSLDYGVFEPYFVETFSDSDSSVFTQPFVDISRGSADAAEEKGAFEEKFGEAPIISF